MDCSALLPSTIACLSCDGITGDGAAPAADKTAEAAASTDAAPVDTPTAHQSPVPAAAGNDAPHRRTDGKQLWFLTDKADSVENADCDCAVASFEAGGRITRAIAEPCLHKESIASRNVRSVRARGLVGSTARTDADQRHRRAQRVG